MLATHTSTRSLSCCPCHTGCPTRNVCLRILSLSAVPTCCWCCCTTEGRHPLLFSSHCVCLCVTFFTKQNHVNCVNSVLCLPGHRPHHTGRTLFGKLSDCCTISQCPTPTPILLPLLGMVTKVSSNGCVLQGYRDMQFFFILHIEYFYFV